MRPHDQMSDYAAAYLRMAEPYRSPNLGLVWVREAHTGGRGTPGGLARYHPVAQDGLQYVINLLHCGERLEEAERGIRSALGCQITAADDEHFGCFRWYIEDERLVDSNGTFFTCYNLLIIDLYFGEQLTPDLRDAIRTALRRSMSHFLNKPLRTGGTNVFLGDNTLGVLLSEMFEGGVAPALRENWQHFYRDTFSRGILERLSSTYYGVCIPLAALAVRWVKDPFIRRVARETLEGMLLEVKFFEGRTPLPARRTYNAHGEAIDYAFISWVLGDNNMTVASIVERGWLHSGAVAAWLALESAGVDRQSFPLAAPRILTGRFGGGGSVYSYFHRDYTLGCFSRHPEQGGRITSPYEMNAGFSGDGDNLGLLGIAFQFEDGAWGGLPGAAELHQTVSAYRKLSPTNRIDFTSVAHQHENIMIWLSDVDGVDCSLRSFGATVRLPQFTGSIVNQKGETLTGEGGTVDDGWIFFMTDRARFAVRPLQRSDDNLFHPVRGTIDWYQLPEDRSVIRPFPGPWHVHPDPATVQVMAAPCRRAGLYLPYFKGEEARLVRRDNLSAGMVVVCDSAEVAAADFIQRCLSIEIEEGWQYDAYLRSETRCGGVRKVSLRTSDLEMALTYDTHHNQVLSRSVNGVEATPPSAAPAVRFGI